MTHSPEFPTAPLAEHEPTLSRERSRTIGRLVLEVLDPGDPQTAIVTAHKTLTGEDRTYESLTEELAAHMARDQYELYPLIPANDHGRKVSLMALEQIFEGEGMKHYNLLRSWPFYQYLYESYIKEAIEDEPARDHPKNSLLIGVHHALSARTFEQMSRRLYGAENAFIIDPIGGADKARHGVFVRGDGLHMPIASDSMSFVQTSMLFDWIGRSGRWDEHWPADDTPISPLLANIHRVLEPGGHLLLYEKPIGYDAKDGEPEEAAYKQARANDLQKLLRDELERLGFDILTIEPSWVPQNDKWLFDDGVDLASYPRVVDPHFVGVVARKPLPKPRTQAVNA